MVESENISMNHQRPIIRPAVVRPNLGQAPVSTIDQQSPEEFNSQSDDDDGFTGGVEREQSEEEVKRGDQEAERQRLEDNVEAYDKKLSEFERMFLFVNDELDFKQLSEMAEHVELHKDRSNGQSTSSEARELNVTDMYGFIKKVPSTVSSTQNQAAQESEDEDDFSQRLMDRRAESCENHPVRHRKQEKLPTTSSKSQVTSVAKFQKGSLKVQTTSQTEESKRNKNMEELEQEQIQNTLGRIQVRREPLCQSLDPEVDRRRCSKWFDMLEDLKNHGKTHSKLKSRSRKGIPDSIRGIAWPILAGADNMIPEEYQQGGKQEWMRDLLRQKLDRRQLICIFNDIPRTMPNHVYFAEQGGTGQKALFAVLKCLSIYLPGSGYVQGMNSLCGTLMTYTSPEDTFAIVVSLFVNYQMQENFLPGLPGLEKNFYILLCLMKKYIPKVFVKFNELGFTPQMYASRWFMTLYSDFFPIDVVVRIFDIYLMEGRKVVFRIALAFLKLLEKEMLAAQDLELPLTRLKTFPGQVDVEVLLATAHKYTFSKTLVDQYESEYKTRPVQEILQICKLL